jgi:hypothetical protein
MVAVLIAVFLAVLVAAAALIGFPIYYWIQDRRRRGQPLAISGIAGALLLGLLGVVAVWLFILARP